MKKFLTVLGVVVFSLVGSVVFSNQVIKTAVTVVASKITGAPVHMDGFSLNILSSTIRISGFKMFNPDGFPAGILVSCPKIKVIYDCASLFKQKRHFLIVEIELKEMGLVKNKEGKLNVDSLTIAQQSNSSSPIPMQIDILTLSIGKIVYKDYTIGAEPSVQVYDVNIQKIYKGIPSAQQLALLVLAEPMKATAIKGAAIYGAAMLTGGAALPFAVAATFIGKDSVQQIIDISFEHVYKVSLVVVERMGTITEHDASDGVINANINGAMVALILRKDADNKTEITISARKYMFPRLDIAGGVLYQILDKLQ
ncbi:MAG: hypothetical protein NTV07_05480 [Candidatus Omnitrophica bacterium]|nr:hypothetical protein [Candidatus Omnitrophota bacterium]